jgi:hypothetical protein
MRPSFLIAPCLAVLATLAAGTAPVAAACDTTATNNPAFSSKSATRAMDACDISARVAAKPPIKPVAPPDRTAKAKPKPGAVAPDGAVVEKDEDGNTLYRYGDTTVKVGGYVRADFVAQSGGKAGTYRTRN